MNVPDHLTGVASNILGCELEAAIRKGRWAVIYGLAPYKDGDQWCVLLGDDLAVGIAGFGDTPEAAIHAFDEAMRAA